MSFSVQVPEYLIVISTSLIRQLVGFLTLFTRLRHVWEASTWKTRSSFAISYYKNVFPRALNSEFRFSCIKGGKPPYFNALVKSKTKFRETLPLFQACELCHISP